MKSIHQTISKDILAKQLSKPGGKFAVAVYLLLNSFVAVAMIVSIFQGDAEDALACVKIFILFLLPWLMEWKLKIELSAIFIIIVHLFMYASIILGELDSYYLKYPFWDNMLHTINGFLCASAGFMAVNLILDRKPSHRRLFHPIYTVVFAFCLSMTIGVLWEFYEFGMDNFFNRDMQKDTIIHTIKSVKLVPDNHSLVVIADITDVSINGIIYDLGGYVDIGLYDTMGDLLNNFAGALIFCVIGYFVTKKEWDYQILNGFFHTY